MSQYADLAWAPLLTKAGGTKITVDGNPGVTYSLNGVTGVGFYKGQLVVAITAVHVKAGAALTIANLLASRI